MKDVTRDSEMNESVEAYIDALARIAHYEFRIKQTQELINEALDMRSEWAFKMHASNLKWFRQQLESWLPFVEASRQHLNAVAYRL